MLELLATSTSRTNIKLTNSTVSLSNSRPPVRRVRPANWRSIRTRASKWVSANIDTSNDDWFPEFSSHWYARAEESYTPDGSHRMIAHCWWLTSSQLTGKETISIDTRQGTQATITSSFCGRTSRDLAITSPFSAPFMVACLISCPWFSESMTPDNQSTLPESNTRVSRTW